MFDCASKQALLNTTQRMKHVVPGFNPAILQQPLQLTVHVLVYSICSKHLVTWYGDY